NWNWQPIAGIIQVIYHRFTQINARIHTEENQNAVRVIKNFRFGKCIRLQKYLISNHCCFDNLFKHFDLHISFSLQHKKTPPLKPALLKPIKTEPVFEQKGGAWFQPAIRNPVILP
ncbi:MAG: hypothetical protein ACFCU6_04115, partial [Balneolaceae bacterium]